MIKHATASTFVFYQFPEGWRLGLVAQPRLGRHMIVGGHVELDETQARPRICWSLVRSSDSRPATKLPPGERSVRGPHRQPTGLQHRGEPRSRSHGRQQRHRSSAIWPI
jgi:hypothetical protein